MSLNMEKIRQENFENMQLTVIEQDNQDWFTAEEIGKALGFADPKAAVMQILNRNRKLFSGFYKKSRSELFDEIISKKHRKITCFCSQGAILVALIAKTPKSKALGFWFAKFMAQNLEHIRGRLLTLKKNNLELSGDVGIYYGYFERMKFENKELKRKLAIAEKRLQFLITTY